MTRPLMPWEPGFFEQQAADVEQAVENMAGGVLSNIPIPNISNIIPNIPTITPSTSTTSPTGTTTSVTVTTPKSPSGAVQSVSQQLQQAAIKAAEQALLDAAPTLQKNVITYVQQYMTGALVGGNVIPQIPNINLPDVTIDGKSVTQVAAKAHGLKAFAIGIGMSVLAGITTVLGQLGGVNFLTKDGLVVTGTLLVGAVVSGITSYLARLQIAPTYEQKLLAAPPPVNGKTNV